MHFVMDAISMVHKYKMKGSPENLQTIETTYASAWDTHSIDSSSTVNIVSYKLDFNNREKRAFRKYVYLVFNKSMIFNTD